MLELRILAVITSLDHTYWLSRSSTEWVSQILYAFWVTQIVDSGSIERRPWSVFSHLLDQSLMITIHSCWRLSSKSCNGLIQWGRDHQTWWNFSLELVLVICGLFKELWGIVSDWILQFAVLLSVESKSVCYELVEFCFCVFCGLLE